MALPPFRRVPYDASQATARMSDLVMRGGDIRAQGELQRGALWGGAVNQLGQIAGKTLGDLAAYREEAPKREAQQLALDKLRREESTEKNLAGLRQIAADGNLSSLDTAKLYEQAGYPEQALRIKEGYLKNLEIMGKVDAQKIDLAAHVATGVKKAGYTEAAFLNGLKRLEASGHFPPEELQPYRDAVEQLRKQIPAQALPRGIGVGPGADTPAPVQNAIKQFTDAVLERSPVDMTIRVLSEGAQMWQGGRMIAENKGEPKPPENLSLQQRYANLIAEGKFQEAKALLGPVSEFRDASQRPPAAGGAPDTLTISGRNTAIRARENDLAAAEAAYQRAISPRAATVTEFQLTGRLEHIPTAAEKADAKRRYEASVRQIQNAYEEQIAPPGRTKAVMPALSPTEAEVVGRSSLGDLSRPSPIPPPGALVQPVTAQPGPASVAPPVAPGAFIVTAPNGQMFTFATQAQADEFKRRAGLK